VTSLLIAGATGAVGARALAAALADPRIDRVVAPTRRPLPPQDGLSNPVLDLDALSEDDCWQVDAVVCALGTTRKEAGSREAFRHVDHDLPLRIAELTRGAGATTYAVVSSVGASPASRNFYLQVKGETERDLEQVGFESLTIVRPSGLVGGVRTRRSSLGDHLVGASRLVAPLVPARYRPVHVDRVSTALIEAAVAGHAGVHVLESESL
jgi:uncharacterized protein YbjT (DUF2867 family)